jgi:hypothetical protein
MLPAPASPSSVMKEKIRRAQDARRQRLRTRLEEMAASGNAVQLAAPPSGRASAAATSTNAAAGSPRARPDVPLHVHFNEPGGRPGSAPAHDDRPSIPVFDPRPAAQQGGPPWAGLRLEIESPPARAEQQWPDTPAVFSDDLLGPDSPETEAARQDWRNNIAKNPAACLRQSPFAGEHASPGPAQASDFAQFGQPLQRADVLGVLQEMKRPRRAPGDDSEPEVQQHSPAAYNDIANWVSPDGSVASFHEYQEKKREKEQELAREAGGAAHGLQELVAKLQRPDDGGRRGEDGPGGRGEGGADVKNADGKSALSATDGSLGQDSRGDREGRAWLRVVHRRLEPSLAGLRQAKLKVTTGDLSSWQVTAEVGQLLGEVETNLQAVAEVLQERLSLETASTHQGLLPQPVEAEAEAEVMLEAEVAAGADPGRVGGQVKLKQVDALRGQVSLLEARVLHLSQAKSALELKIDALQGRSKAAAASGAGLADTKKMSKFQLEMSAAKDAVR